MVHVRTVDHIGEVRLANATNHVDDADERVGILVGIRFEDHAVHDAEHRDRAADAESQRQHGRGSETARLRQSAPGLAEVLPCIDEKRSACCLGWRELRRLRLSKTAHRGNEPIGVQQLVECHLSRARG